MSNCTAFITDWDDDWRPCTCPKCKGFLPANFPIDKQFQCRKCGQVLETIPGNPHRDPDDTEADLTEDYEYGGKICIVPDYAYKIVPAELPLKRKRRRKHKTERWAMGDGFSRRVWNDGKQSFIEVNGERIILGDPRIKLVTGGESVE